MKLKTLNILIAIIIILTLSRFYKCRYTGKKDVNPISSCSSNPPWATYGYKLSIGLSLDIIIILMLTYLVYSK